MRAAVAQLTAAAVVEPVEVLARGLGSILAECLPGASVRLVPDPPALAAVSGLELVVCGPSLTSRVVDVTDAARSARWVAVVAEPSDVDYATLLRSGVQVLIDVRAPLAHFGAATSAALRQEPWVSDSLAAALAGDLAHQLRQQKDAAGFGLTPREAEVLRLMATGAGNRDIAERLFISVNTVKNHVRSVLDKTHAATRTESVMTAARAGMVDAQG